MKLKKGWKAGVRTFSNIDNHCGPVEPVFCSSCRTAGAWCRQSVADRTGKSIRLWNNCKHNISLNFQNLEIIKKENPYINNIRKIF